MLDTFDARRVAPWQLSSPVISSPPKPDFADDVSLKKSYGIALGKGLEPFPAGLEIFSDNTPKALWVSSHWINDPIVIAARDAYQKTLKELEKPLDKEELLHEVLLAARKAEEDKDKVAFFKLYSEIAGYTGKIAVDASTNNFNNTNNTVKITLVKPKEDENTNTIVSNNIKSKIQNDELPIKLKLVSGSS